MKKWNEMDAVLEILPRLLGISSSFKKTRNLRHLQ